MSVRVTRGRGECLWGHVTIHLLMMVTPAPVKGFGLVQDVRHDKSTSKSCLLGSVGVGCVCKEVMGNVSP